MRRHSNPAQPTATTGPWPALERDEPICLIDPHGWRLTGRVDAMTEDRSTVWIQLDGGRGRRLVHQQDGYQIE
ncbi:hypothetical protein [Arthrobacter sp. A5]|uniref:hypothetical protein n=1 Tax=Arthrobacter sp. A5 TaxID=576926 RepID=UPI003DA9421D